MTSAAGIFGTKIRPPKRITSATSDTSAVLPETSPSSSQHVAELADRIGRVQRDPQQLAELPDDQHDRDAVQVADQDGARQVLGDPLQPRQARDEEAGADHQRQRGRHLAGLRGAGRRDADQRRRHQRRERALRPDRDLARGAQQRVAHHREEQGVQPDHRRQPGELGVGHARRDRQRGDRQAREHVVARAAAPGSDAGRARSAACAPTGARAARGETAP